ncbi:type IV pili methyl-accepting chemotaxis transducer N-terminal domain-containing protein [Arcobacter lanthieri]|uniref:type IV pili methyl-accepting chemotaxis transducer N-terminal domain-containing protein n=1 Tax=Aliarcobacter lanthieri TaxID=1355374 RepID=UPI0019245CB8|nr:type IV pili methyl-accepting chemotaxis transducer N-terminal domain-containing protein [Aliarcobacter lanthieri]MBL3520508.1 type IV pili methyl-accepting chemotaxis transducer N-terminal domain-containing protein [Aliarcobacter lanthieri]
MKKNKISTNIKIIGILFAILMLSIVAITFYLNNKNEKDALIINIAGKQRMLTQNISKNIFYLSQFKDSSFDELNSSTAEFIYSLKTLREGNNLPKIKEAPTSEIANQLMKIEILWSSFYQTVVNFKELLHKENSQNELQNILKSIHSSNTILLNEVDNLVSLYTVYSESKIATIRYLQYFFAVLILILVIYSFIKLKSMEANAIKFLEESKKVMEQNFQAPLEPIKIEAEGEIVEATNTLNKFINKINLVMDDSANAIVQSKNASLKLDELTNEFNDIIENLTNSSEISKHLNRSEDIVIQSQEDLMNSNKRLLELKNELDKILISFDKKD